MDECILVVDDDRQLTLFLEKYLSKQGYEVICAATAKDMLAQLDRHPISLLVLDVGLPDRDGFDLTREIRQKSNLPIVVLSARDEVFDRVVGLELGADDYITKPFEPRELLARMRSVLRRAQPQGGEEPASSGRVYRFSDLELDLVSRTLSKYSSRRAIQLTSTEFDILRTLVEHANVVLSRDRILYLVHGSSTFITDRAIDAHIARLRRKIEAKPREPALIKTVHGAGYIFSGSIMRE